MTAALHTKVFLKELGPNRVFATGIFNRSQIYGRPAWHRWVALTGAADDWAAYYGPAYDKDGRETSPREIAQSGVKCFPKEAWALVAGDDDFKAAYRQRWEIR